MAHKVIHESKHILLKVFIGAVTGLLGTVVLYFLYNRNPRASEVEIRKNTIAAWKEYVAAENHTQTTFDSSYARMQQSLTVDANKPGVKTTAINQLCRRDSLTSIQFIGQLSALKKLKDIDQDFVILLGARMVYQQQQTNASLKYSRRMLAISDSLLSAAEIQELGMELNKLNRERLNNITVRIGRNIEYFAEALTKKYKGSYVFDFSDIQYYGNYMALKRSKILKMPTGVAPPDPNKTEQ